MMLEHTQISERRACRLVGLSRDAWRHPPQPDAQTARLAERIQAVAMERRRFGYRRVHDMLQGPDGHPKLLHCWPVKLLQAGRGDYAGSEVMIRRAAASLSL